MVALRITLSALLIVLSQLVIFCQLDIKVGYDGAAFNVENPELIFDQFNTANPWLDQKYAYNKFLHGICAGIRYKPIDFYGIELSISLKSRDTEASGLEPATEDIYYDRLKFQDISYSFGNEFFIGNFSLGASIDYNQFTLKYERPENADTKKLLREEGIGTHFFIGINFPSRGTAKFALRPYIQIPLFDINFAPLDEHINPNDRTFPNDEAYQERPFQYGIQVLFMNGGG